MEIKHILKQYAFTLVVILCVSVMATGFFTVKEKTQYNIDMTNYSKIRIEKTAEGVVLGYGDKEQLIRFDISDKFKDILVTF